MGWVRDEASSSLFSSVEREIERAEGKLQKYGLQQESKYSSQEDRKALISKLLAEREERLRSAATDQDSGRSSPDKPPELFFACDLMAEDPAPSYQLLEADDMAQAPAERGKAPHKPLTATGAAPRCRHSKKQEQDAELTFKPRINSYVGGAGKRRISGKQRLAQLAQNMSKLYEEREMQRLANVEREEKECTFQPALVAKPSSTPAAEACVFDRLLQYEKEKNAERALAAIHLDQAQLRDLSFQPSLPSSSGKSRGQRFGAESVPLHERVWEVQRQREHNMRVLQVEQEAREGLTFVPQISKVSQRIARKDRGHQDVGTRLVADAQLRRERQLKLAEEAEAERAQEATFAPRLSKGTERLADRVPGLQASFEERQRLIEARSKAREDARQSEVAESESSWFKPSIAPRSHKILQRGTRGALEEAPEEMFRRMAVVEGQIRRANHERRVQKEQGKYSFRPTINQVSSALARPSAVEELVRNPRGEWRAQRAAAASAARHRENCTFQPELVARSGTAAGEKYRLPLSEPWRIAVESQHRQRERCRQLEEARALIELEEMRACTFAPKTNSGKAPAGDEPVVIKGLGRFLERRDQAERLQQERELREEQAFRVRPATQKRSALGLTIVEPFELSQANNAGAARREQERLDEARADLTFQPWTKERERREFLESLQLELE